MLVQPLESQLGPAMIEPLGAEAENPIASLASALPSTLSQSDAISRLVPPWTGSMMQNPMQTAFFGPLAGLIQQLMQMLQSFMGCGGYSGYGGSGSSGGCSPYGGEQFFSTASGASTGDPHLSFNGNHWNSMVSQPDLLNSNSIPGGFQVSTQVTTPSSRGITWNQSATISLNNGQTTIGMNNAGQPAIESFGRSLPIADGQTIELGNGASVTRNADGSLSVLARNGYGGQITTTLTAQGEGVNVEASAQNVDLGGALVDGTQQPPYGPIGGPIRDPFPPIITNPIVAPTPISGSPLWPPPPLTAQPFVN